MTRAEEYAERLADLKARQAKRRRHDEAFATLVIMLVAVANVGYLIRGGEASFRSTVVILLTVIAVCVARRRQ